MKKAVLFIMLALMCSLAFAQGQATSAEKDVRVQSEISGFQGATVQARNQTRLQELEQVMAKVQNRTREMLGNLEGLMIQEECEGDCKVIATGRGNAKFLGLFSYERVYRYEIQDDGQVVQQKRWYDYLWRFEK